MLPAVVTMVCAIITTVAAFLPWYEPDIAPMFSPDSASGWDATLAAKLLVVGAVVALVASALVALDARRTVRLDPSGVGALAAVAVAAMAAAAAAAAFRTIRLPEPAEFLSRQIGLYIALAAAVVGVGAALVQLLTSTRPDEYRRNAQVRGPRRR